MCTGTCSSSASRRGNSSAHISHLYGPPGSASAGSPDDSRGWMARRSSAGRRGGRRRAGRVRAGGGDGGDGARTARRRRGGGLARARVRSSVWIMRGRCAGEGARRRRRRKGDAGEGGDAGDRRGVSEGEGEGERDAGGGEGEGRPQSRGVAGDSVFNFRRLLYFRGPVWKQVYRGYYYSV